MSASRQVSDALSSTRKFEGREALIPYRHEFAGSSFSTEGAGTSGLSLYALCTRKTEIEDVRRAISCWQENDALNFPYSEVVGYFQAVGRNQAAPPLISDLRRAADRYQKEFQRSEISASRELLLNWLPMTFDQVDGTYDSYIGASVAEFLISKSSAGNILTTIDAFTAALVADLAIIEAQALAALPGSGTQYARARAATRALARIHDFLPQAPADSTVISLAEAALRNRCSASDLAEKALKSAEVLLESSPYYSRRS